MTRTAVVSLPRGQGKTQLCAALMLCHLVGPESEPRGELYSAASDRHQAARIYREALAMLLADPELADRIVARDFAKTITDEVTGGVYQALSSDHRKGHSLSPSLVIYDELGRAPDRELYDALDGGLGKRDGLMVIISTQAPGDNHVLSELVDHGERVNAGVVEDARFYAAIWRAADDADPWAEETWRACNPALGDFLSLADFRAQAQQARRSPAAEPAFRNQRLNQRVESASPFISKTVWLECGDPVLRDFRGLPVYGGLDLSETADLTALVLIAPHEGRWHVRPTFWLPADGLRERARLDRVPYDVWAQQGHLLVSPGRTVEYSYVAEHLRGLFERYDVRRIAFDRWNWRHLKPWLERAGLGERELGRFVEFGQGYRSFSPALRDLESALLGGRLAHGLHPVLTMCALNAAIEMDAAGNRKPTKSKSRGRIDGLTALTMALSVAATEEPEPKRRYQMMFFGGGR
jgi:phage terminase large subunit-like protein